MRADNLLSITQKHNVICTQKYTIKTVLLRFEHRFFRVNALNDSIYTFSSYIEEAYIMVDYI